MSVIILVHDRGSGMSLFGLRDLVSSQIRDAIASGLLIVESYHEAVMPPPELLKLSMPEQIEYIPPPELEPERFSAPPRCTPLFTGTSVGFESQRVWKPP